jgi:hypothetical protein
MCTWYVKGVQGANATKIAALLQSMKELPTEAKFTSILDYNFEKSEIK